ncbi:MAG: radical SAM protein [Planctomycetota bacterium]
MGWIRRSASFIKIAYGMACEQGLHKMLRELHRAYTQHARPRKSRFKPTSIEWEITTHCNLECTMCRRSFGLAETRELKHMNLRLFSDLLQRFPFLELISFRGGGEPILHPRIVEIAEKVAGKGMKLSLFTNGMAMKPSLARELLSVPVSEIVFSIDAGRPDTYARIRRKGNLEQVLAHLEQVREQIAAHPNGTALSVMFILMRSNYHEFPELLRRIDGKGISALVAKHVNPGFNPDVSEELLQPSEEKEFRNMVRSLRSNETRVIYSQELYESQNQGERLCSRIWETPFVTVEGDLSLCPMTFYNAKINYGNVMDSGFNKLWNCTDIKEHRRQIASKELKICNTCPIMRDWNGHPEQEA